MANTERFLVGSREGRILCWEFKWNGYGCLFLQDWLYEAIGMRYGNGTDLQINSYYWYR